MISDEGSRRPSVHEMRVRSDGGHSLLNWVFGALTHPRRRCILYYLRDHEQTGTSDLASHLAAWEQDSSTNEVSAADVEQVKTDPLHSHLPKLHDYDSSNMTREATPSAILTGLNSLMTPSTLLQI